MIWYALIFSGIIITLLCFRKKRTITRMGIEQTNIFERFFGTDFGITLCACFTMLAILSFILKADPTLPELADKQKQIDREIYAEMGKRLGVRATANTVPKGKVMIIARHPNEGAKPYHDALLNSIKTNLGSNLEMGPVIYLEAFTEEMSPTEFERPFRITNAQLDNLTKLNPDCTTIISLVGVEETFFASRLAIEARSGKRAFLLVTDNLYMLGSAIANKCINYCIAPNPSYNAKNQLFTAEAPVPRFSDVYIEVEQKNLKDVARRYRRMLYVKQRMH